MGCRDRFSDRICIANVGLSIWSKKIRPGSWTGMLLFFPLSIWVYSIGYWQHSISLTDFLISGAITSGRLRQRIINFALAIMDNHRIFETQPNQRVLNFGLRRTCVFEV